MNKYRDYLAEQARAAGIPPRPPPKSPVRVKRDDVPAPARKPKPEKTVRMTNGIKYLKVPRSQVEDHKKVGFGFCSPEIWKAQKRSKGK